MLQFPEGLKKQAPEKAEELESQGHVVYVSASSCFGACDLCLDEAGKVGAEKIIHFGHSKFMEVKGKIKIEYNECFSEVDWKACSKMLKKAASFLKKEKAGKVSLVFPVQHAKNAQKVQNLLEKCGISVKLGKGGKHTQHKGQVLGCDSSAAKVPGVNALVYFGGGNFHPLALPKNMPVLCANPHINDCYFINEEIAKAEKRRKGALLAASQASSFGILVSTKCGQMNLKAAKITKKLLEKKGKQVVLLVANELSPSSISNFTGIGAYINTACPRIRDDSESFGKPVVNVADIKRLAELIDAQK